jgi:hypothetical protein
MVSVPGHASAPLQRGPELQVPRQGKDHGTPGQRKLDKGRKGQGQGHREVEESSGDLGQPLPLNPSQVP